MELTPEEILAVEAQTAKVYDYLREGTEKIIGDPVKIAEIMKDKGYKSFVDSWTAGCIKDAYIFGEPIHPDLLIARDKLVDALTKLRKALNLIAASS